MDDLISRSALIKSLEPYGLSNGSVLGAHSGKVDIALQIIENAPTVDAVEVVRCKNCKHYGWEQELRHGRTQRFCRLHKGLVCVTKDSFCSYGERGSE